jgi:hypothetical protein
MQMKYLTPIPHSFKTSTRSALVHTLRCIIDDPEICNVHNRGHREIAKALGISESTWKRARGVGGESHKVDIYYLLKFIANYSNEGGIALFLPSHPDYVSATKLIHAHGVDQV